MSDVKYLLLELLLLFWMKLWGMLKLGWLAAPCCWVTSVVSDSVWPHRQQPTRLPRPWDSPGKNTGVGCHFLLQCMKVKNESEVAQWCLTLSDPMDCSPPGSSIHGIFQARVLEWGAIAFSYCSLEPTFTWWYSRLCCIHLLKRFKCVFQANVSTVSYANIHTFCTLPVKEKLTKYITKSLNEYDPMVYRN